MTATASPPITPGQFLWMPETEGLELVGGTVVEVPGGSMASYIAGALFFPVSALTLAGRRGWAFPPGTGVAIWPGRNRVRKPDLTYLRRGRLPGDRPLEGWLTVAPDLVAEVVSPNDLAEDLERKLAEYREAGIPLIWVIYPATRTAHILGANRQRSELDPGGVLDGKDIPPASASPSQTSSPPRQGAGVAETLPDHRNSILGEPSIAAYNRDALHQRLGNEHAVERVAVDQRQFRAPERVHDRHREFRYL